MGIRDQVLCRRRILEVLYLSCKSFAEIYIYFQYGPNSLLMSSR